MGACEHDNVGAAAALPGELVLKHDMPLAGAGLSGDGGAESRLHHREFVPPRDELQTVGAQAHATVQVRGQRINEEFLGQGEEGGYRGVPASWGAATGSYAPSPSTLPGVTHPVPPLEAASLRSPPAVRGVGPCGLTRYPRRPRVPRQSR